MPQKKEDKLKHEDGSKNEEYPKYHNTVVVGGYHIRRLNKSVFLET